MLHQESSQAFHQGCIYQDSIQTCLREERPYWLKSLERMSLGPICRATDNRTPDKLKTHLVVWHRFSLCIGLFYLLCGWDGKEQYWIDNFRLILANDVRIKIRLLEVPGWLSH